MADASGPPGAPPTNPQAYAGMGQGPMGFGQGGVGSMVGQTYGPSDGLQRFNTGQMDETPISRLIGKVLPGASGRLPGGTQTTPSGPSSSTPSPPAPPQGSNPWWNAVIAGFPTGAQTHAGANGQITTGPKGPTAAPPLPPGW